MPLAHALGDVAPVLEQERHGGGAVEPAWFAIHWRAQDAVMQRVLPGVDGGARRRAGRRRIGRGQEQAFIGELVHIRRGIADSDAAAIEARISPADVIQQKNYDIWLLAVFAAKPASFACATLSCSGSWTTAYILSAGFTSLR